LVWFEDLGFGVLEEMRGEVEKKTRRHKAYKQNGSGNFLEQAD
jgi:hypothetical protein